MNETKTFGRGIPTEVDVERLVSEFGTPRPGDTITYEAISRAIGVSRASSRWQSVVLAWRRKLDREANIILRAQPNEGFVALDAMGRVDLCGRTYAQGLRRIGRASVVAARTDRSGLPADEAKKLDHIQDVGARLREAAATAAKELRWEDAMADKSPRLVAGGR